MSEYQDLLESKKKDLVVPVNKDEYLYVENAWRRRNVELTESNVDAEVGKFILES
eukprot:Awhi_evm1s10383